MNRLTRFMEQTLLGEPINGGVPFERIDNNTVGMPFDRLEIVFTEEFGNEKMCINVYWKDKQMPDIPLAANLTKPSAGDTLTITGIEGRIHVPIEWETT